MCAEPTKYLFSVYIRKHDYLKRRSILLFRYRSDSMFLESTRTVYYTIIHNKVNNNNYKTQKV